MSSKYNKKTDLPILLFIIILFSIAIIISLISYGLILKASLDISNTFVYLAGILLLSFLILLIVRYIALIWYSYLDYTEGLSREAIAYTPSVSIIVPAYNEEVVIDGTIRNLLDLDYPDYEVIIVDDGSTDNTYRRARTWVERYPDKKLKVISKKNEGKALALNHGIKQATGNIIFCMDGDSQLRRDSLRWVVRHFVDPSVGAVAGNVKVINRRNLWTNLQTLEYIEGLNLVRRFQGFFRIVNIIPGPCGAFKKSMLKEVGFYANDTFAEDCDVTLRILSKGWKVCYEPRAVSLTEAPEGLLDLIKQRYRWTRGVIQAVRKNAGGLIKNARQFPGNIFTAAYMVFEAAVWPAINIVAHIFVVALAFFFGFSPLLFFWWAQIITFDTIAALYCIMLERESLRLIIYSLIYRTFFILLIDTCKILAIVEEILGLRMRWGKLERVGFEAP